MHFTERQILGDVFTQNSLQAINCHGHISRSDSVQGCSQTCIWLEMKCRREQMIGSCWKPSQGRSELPCRKSSLVIFDWFWLARLLWRECDVPGLSKVTNLWRCCHTNPPAPPRFHPWAPPELLSLQQHQPHPSLFDLFPVWHQPQQSLVTNQPWREHTGMCFQGEGFLFDLLAPRGREGASHLVQCFIHSHVIKISWIYSSACL